MNVKVVKLISGEDLICELKEDMTYYCLINPIIVGMTPQGLGMASYSPFIDHKKSPIKIAKNSNAIMYIAEPLNDIANEYRVKFGGIALPETKISI